MANDPLDGTPYRAIAPLGRGAMGEVLEAEHVALARPVVVKLLHERLRARPDLVDRMRLEGQALAVLAHPNIVSVTDLGVTADDRPYLVMERLHGRTLRDELVARGALPVAEAIAIASQALSALGAAHDAGIVHRDVKLENIFLCDAVEGGARALKLLDFGLAKVVEATGDRRAPRPLEIPTAEGIALGTPRFFSPEQAAGEPIDGRTDVYAMGAVLDELVAGRGPFDHLRSAAEIIEAHLATPPSPPSRFAEQPIPPELDAIILRALAKFPEDRHPTAHAFAEALDALAPTDAPIEAATARVTPIRAFAIAFVIALVLTVAVLAMIRGGH